MKYGLISYNYTTNLGNEIQSIAARRFLPKIDYYIEHEKLNLFDKERDVKTIMNAYYLDCKHAWPPSENINPLLISMHFNTHDFTKDVILTEESINYLSQFGPVGCRDISTLNFLQDQGVESYFSGCLTLTLDNDNNKTQELDDSEKYIIINTTHWNNKLYSFLRDKTNIKIYSIHQNTAFEGLIPNQTSSLYNYKEKFYMAENLLKIYENAECVITDRLHAAFPSTALKTPVILLKEDEKLFDPERFEGLSDYLLTSTLDDYLNNYNQFDVNNPPENSKKYLKMRKNLIKKCESFTGYINPTYKTNENNIDIKTMELLLKINSKSRSLAYQNQNNLRKINKEKNKNLKKIKSQKKTIKKQEKTIKEMKQSKSWKVTKPIRIISGKLRK